MTLYPPFFTGIVGGFGHAHDIYLQMAVDFGLPGLVVFLALLVALAASLVTAAHMGRSQPVEDFAVHLAIGLFGSLLVVAIHGLVDAPLATPRVYALVFILFGVARRQAVALSASPDGRSPPRVLSPATLSLTLSLSETAYSVQNRFTG